MAKKKAEQPAAAAPVAPLVLKRLEKLGKQQTEYFTVPLALSKGDRSLEVSVTTDGRGKTPTGSASVKVKSGVISTIPDDEDVFHDAWADLGVDIYRFLKGELIDLGGLMTGEEHGQTNAFKNAEGSEDTASTISGAHVVDAEMKEEAVAAE